MLVLCCSATECPNGNTTGPDGAFTNDKLPLAQRMVKVQENLDIMPRQGETIAPVLLSMDGVTVDVGTLYIPLMGAGATFGPSLTMPQPLDVGDGLRLTMIRGDVQLSLGVKTYNVAARTVPLGHLPKTGFDVKGEKIIAVWALLPFGSTSKTPIPITAQVMAAPGAAVNFRTVSDLDGSISDAVPGHAAMDGKSVSTDPGKGITTITWLLLSTP